MWGNAMRKVKNKKPIRLMAFRTLRANRLRNVVAVLAIALTTMLFAVVFTISMSFVEGFQQANFRAAGGLAHASFKNLTLEQYNELKNDPGIKAYSLRRIVGMPQEAPFHKTHVEVGYSDENDREWMMLKLKEGQYPEEGTAEAATDTRVLALLGVKPVIGAPFTLTFYVDGVKTTENFILSGFWEYDKAISASHVLVPQSRAEEIFAKLGTSGKDGMTSRYTMSTLFDNSMDIEGRVQKVLENSGYQNDDTTKENFVLVGVNWGYVSAQFAQNMDFVTVAGFVLLLLLILFTGYLIIYNVFQISVVGDIRFYGLLKTIGTTPRQLKRIIRIQALALSGVGIPLGLLLGYFLGVALAPAILSRMAGVMPDAQSASPVIFIGSSLFSLLTVLLSCARPGRVAARVSPIEAIRYTEVNGKKKSKRKMEVAVSPFRLAFFNLGRSRIKTVVTVLSLSLAIILLNLTFTFAAGFSMDKYLSRRMASDFIIAAAGYFQVAHNWAGDGVQQDAVTQIEQQGGIEAGGYTYGRVTPMQQFVPEERYRQNNSRHRTPEQLEQLVQNAERLPDGRLVDDQMDLYGMEDFPQGKLQVLAGDVGKLNDPSGGYIAAAFLADDYGKPKPESHWVQLGDRVTIRYIDEVEYFEPATGKVYRQEIPEGVEAGALEMRVLKQHEVTNY